MNFSLGEKLRQWRHLREGGTRPPFYVLPQTYEIRYETMVKNESAKETSAYIVLPVPPSTDYQTVARMPTFFPENVMMSKDPTFGNQYAYGQLEFAPREQKTVREEYTITVSPRKVSIPDSFALGEYHPANLARLDLMKFKNEYTDAGDERVKKIVQEVVGEERRVSEIIKRLNEYVITRLVYGNPIEGLYSSKDALEKEKVDCGGFDTLLAALCIAAGIPARIISGFWAGYDKNDMHAWLEIMLPNGEWIPADPSVEHLARRGRTKKTGALGFAGSDRITLSIGCGIPIIVEEASLTLDILQNPIIVPHENKKSLVMETKFTACRVDEI